MSTPTQTGLFGQPVEEPQKTRWTVSLSIPLVARIFEDMDHQRAGGFQSHMADTRARIDETTGALTYHDVWLGKTWRYANCYGDGGWQKCCRALLQAVAAKDRSDEVI